MWAEKFYDSLNKAIDVAASKGNLKDLLEVADRRFPEWCAVEKGSREAAARLKGEEEVEVQIGTKELTSTPQSEQKQGIQIFIEGEVINEEET